MDRFPSVIEPGVYHKWPSAIFLNPNSSLRALDEVALTLTDGLEANLSPW
jgi:hypothetical protein